MKRMTIGLLACVCLTAGCVAPSGDADRVINILLTYGGHGFEQEAFFEMFDNLEGITTTRGSLLDAPDLLKPGIEQEYDVVVMYDMLKSSTPAQREALVALLNKGIGVVALHHNLGGYRDWDAYTDIVGGKYLFKTETHEGKEYTKSTFKHGVDMDITVVDTKHPITRGVEDFTIHDEAYGGTYCASDNHLLLTTDHPACGREIAWTTRHGKSPIAYIMLGHDSKAWANPMFPKLLTNAIRWADGER